MSCCLVTLFDIVHTTELTAFSVSADSLARQLNKTGITYNVTLRCLVVTFVAMEKR